MLKRMLCAASAALVLAMLLLCGCGGGSGGFANDGTASGMLTRINGGRTTAGVGALTADSDLQAIAQAQAAYMASIATIKPTDAGGTDLLVNVQNAGFTGTGRILANGTTEASTYARLASEPADQPIINGDAYTLAGIGYATTANTQWWVIVVATSKTP